mmetsp:Transcript_34201/g.84091  ORF Transcript_34201/g.84091 Transcript_34201/m.84091 type:complete len:588 (+) Transcript_34201:776-2539(+)
MHADDLLADPVRGAARHASLPHKLVEEALRLPPVLVPPQPARAAVVARAGGDGEVPVVPRLAVAPALDLEPQDPQLEKHRANLLGHVPKVLPADHHVGGRLDRAQVLEPLLAQPAPRLVLPAPAVLGDLPHAEEAEDVVDAVRVEVLLHVREAPAPPRAPVAVHSVPVVGGESPVLLRVARRTAVLVQLEQLRLRPHVAAAARHPNREVSLERNAILSCINRRLLELQMQVELLEVHAHDLPVVGARGARNGVGIGRALAPGRAVEPLVVDAALLIELHLERSVHLEPAGVVLNPLLEVLVSHDLVLAHLVEDALHDPALLVEDLGVVDLPVAVELVDERLGPPRRAAHVHAHLARVVLAHGGGADVGGVEGEGGGCGVRGGVFARVVDREDLDELEACLGAPVNHLLEIKELADARRVAGLDARHRDGHTRRLEHRVRVAEGLVANHELGVRVADRGHVGVLLLASHTPVRVPDAVLVLEGELALGHGGLPNVDAPADVHHGEHLLLAPRAQLVGGACDPDAVARLHAGGEDGEAHGDPVGAGVGGLPGDLLVGGDLVLGLDVGLLVPFAKDGVGEAARRERRRLG